MSLQPAPTFPFIDVPRHFTLIDRELELVEPDVRFVDALLDACHHPLTRQYMPAQSRTTRDAIHQFLQQNPRGHTQPDASHGVSPGYTFWMRFRPIVPPVAGDALARISRPEVSIAGSISLRIGHNVNLDRYLGHIGYHVLPPARGRRFAERAARLLLPIARAHGHRMLWITVNPDNAASRRTCELLAASYIDTVSIPRDNPLYSQGDRQKCRYRVDL